MKGRRAGQLDSSSERDEALSGLHSALVEGRAQQIFKILLIVPQAAPSLTESRSYLGPEQQARVRYVAKNTAL